MAKMSAFGKAFAEARKRGDKEFTFGGKKFHTRTKEDEAAAKPKAESKPVSTAGAIASRNVKSTPKIDMPKMPDTKVERREPVSTAGAIASGNVKSTPKVEMPDTKVERKKPVSTAGAIASKNFKNGGKVSSCSKRADGIAKRGKTKCRMV
jgi:hypothetical protein